VRLNVYLVIKEAGSHFLNGVGVDYDDDHDDDTRHDKA